jgi:hypothetical protein
MLEYQSAAILTKCATLLKLNIFPPIYILFIQHTPAATYAIVFRKQCVDVSIVSYPEHGYWEGEYASRNKYCRYLAQAAHHADRSNIAATIYHVVLHLYVLLKFAAVFFEKIACLFYLLQFTLEFCQLLELRSLLTGKKFFQVY